MIKISFNKNYLIIDSICTLYQVNKTKKIFEKFYDVLTKFMNLIIYIRVGHQGL